MNKLHVLSSLMALLLLVAGCSLAPTYEKPDVNAPSAYKETPQKALDASEAGTWKTAQPSEEMLRGEWWTIFDDAKLNDLEKQAQDANQNLKAAAACAKEARAINQTARVGLFPTLDAGFGPTREKLSPASQFQPSNGNVPSQTLWRAQASASYEVDLFGRVSNLVQPTPTPRRAKRCSARCSWRCRRMSRRTTSTCANWMPKPTSSRAR